MKATISIAGSTDILFIVAIGPVSAIDFPIIGKTIAVATNPPPPKIDIPSAPDFGVYSEATPIMVGQK